MRLSQVWKQATSASTRVTFDKKKHFGELARTRVKLSGDQPLDVCIKGSTEVRFGTRTANLLREHVSRFQKLEIRAPDHETAESLVSSIGEGKPTPLLERLEIHIEKDPAKWPESSYSSEFEEDPAESEFSALPKSFFPCPRLTHLTIPGKPLPARSTPHFKSITSLTINAHPFYYDMDIDGVLDILKSTKKLLHFTYLGQDVFNYYALKSRIISMPHLISADVSVPGCGLEILRKLDAPLLTSVRFDGWRKAEFTEEWVDTLTKPISLALRLLSKRSPNLTHLELCSTVMHKPFNDYQWLMSDTAFPRLEVLRLYAPDINDITLRLGAGRMRSLKRFELLACQGVSVTGILEFAKGRKEGFELLIDACPGVKPEDLAELTKFVKVL